MSNDTFKVLNDKILSEGQTDKINQTTISATTAVSTQTKTIKTSGKLCQTSSPINYISTGTQTEDNLHHYKKKSPPRPRNISEEAKTTNPLPRTAYRDTYIRFNWDTYPTGWG